MLDYEMRVFNQDARPTVMHGGYFSDDAAIKAALRTASGNAVEVWRGADCIYRSAWKTDPKRTLRN